MVEYNELHVSRNLALAVYLLQVKEGIPYNSMMLGVFCPWNKKKAQKENYKFGQMIFNTFPQYFEKKKLY